MTINISESLPEIPLIEKKIEQIHLEINLQGIESKVWQIK